MTKGVVIPTFVLQSFRFDKEHNVLYSSWEEVGRQWLAVETFCIVGNYETIKFRLESTNKILGGGDIYIYYDANNRFEVRIST